MNAVIVVFPGTNRERDMAIALKRATGRKPTMLFHRETALPAGTDLVVLPGGFSYGDYLRCGAMAAQSPIMREVADFAAKGGHVLGVCNVSTNEVNIGSPSSPPMSGSTRFSGCGIRPQTRRLGERMPAMLSRAPLRLAASVSWPSGVQ